MSRSDDKRARTRSLRELYPDLSDDELREAADRWRRYAALLVRIYTRTHGNRDHRNNPSQRS